jgi:hypothetical protein
MLVPFSKPRSVAGYAAESGPNSKGRMPRKSTDRRTDLSNTNLGSTGTTKFEAQRVAEVDGARIGHDYGGVVGKYERSPKESA